MSIDNISIEKMSNEALQNLMLKVGMPKRISSGLLRLYSKRVTPEPKGYVPTAEITRLLVANSLTTEETLKSENVADNAKFSVLGGFTKHLVIPWYWLSKDLGTDLLRTDVPSSIPNKIILPDYGVIVLPKGLVTTTTGDINFIAYKLFRSEESCEIDTFSADDDYTNRKVNIAFSGDRGYRLNYCALQNFYAYGGIIGLVPGENEYSIISTPLTPFEDTDTEVDETNQLKTLLLNTLVYASQQEKTYELPSKSFGKSSKAKSKITRPIFIGEDYKSTITSVKKSSGTGATVSPHWRRGHWRRQAVGKREENKRAWRLIPPTMIGFSKKGEPNND